MLDSHGKLPRDIETNFEGFAKAIGNYDQCNSVKAVNISFEGKKNSKYCSFTTKSAPGMVILAILSHFYCFF